jgi:translation initiation factor IF-3
MKGIRISYSIDKHDLETKIRQAAEFLKNNNTVKVTLVFKGREATHADLGRSKLLQFMEALKEVAQVEEIPKRQGNIIFMVLVPHKS